MVLKLLRVAGGWRAFSLKTPDSASPLRHFQTFYYDSAILTTNSGSETNIATQKKRTKQSKNNNNNKTLSSI